MFLHSGSKRYCTLLLPATGGSLTEKVACLWESALQRGGLFMEEQEASYYLRQFVHCIHYCHKHRVAHRSADWHVLRSSNPSIQCICMSSASNATKALVLLAPSYRNFATRPCWCFGRFVLRTLCEVSVCMSCQGLAVQQTTCCLLKPST